MMAVQATSFHLKNEKFSAQLSLLEHEESFDEGSDGGQELTTSTPSFPNKDIIVTGREPVVEQPSPEESSVFPKICNFVLSIFVIGVLLLCLPLMTIVYMIAGVIPRFIVRLLLSCSNGGRFKLMPISRGFGSTNGNYHTVMLIIRGRCDIDKIRRHMMKILSCLDPYTGFQKFQLQKRVVKKFGYLCYEDRYARFDIKNHVKHFDIRRKNIAMSLNDVIPFLEASHDKPFENDHITPQWELLVIPKFVYTNEEAKLLGTSDRKQFYSVVFRFHHGIMDWNMFQELLVEFLGKTSGRIRSIFSPTTKYSWWTLLKTYLAIPFVGSVAFLNQVTKHWKKFGGLDIQNPRISLSTTKTIDTETFEDVKCRTYTGINSVLTNCVRIAARNLALGQNLEVPRDLRIARVFNTMTCELQGVDSFTIEFDKYRTALERLQATFHAIERQQGGSSLAAQRLFNKIIMLLAGVFPYDFNAWFYQTVLKGDIILEVWPGADEPCTIFGGDLVADIVGWAGISGVDADMKVTVTTYCGRVRANFTGLQGFFGNLTDSQILSYEFDHEYKNLAAVAGVYQSRLYLPPAVDNGL